MNKMKSATCAWISFHNHFFLSDFFFLKEKGPSVWQGRQDSNCLAGAARLELATPGFGDQCSTN